MKIRFWCKSIFAALILVCYNFQVAFSKDNVGYYNLVNNGLYHSYVTQNIDSALFFFTKADEDYFLFSEDRKELLKLFLENCDCNNYINNFKLIYNYLDEELVEIIEESIYSSSCSNDCKKYIIDNMHIESLDSLNSSINYFMDSFLNYDQSVREDLGLGLSKLQMDSMFSMVDSINEYTVLQYLESISINKIRYLKQGGISNLMIFLIHWNKDNSIDSLFNSDFEKFLVHLYEFGALHRSVFYPYIDNQFMRLYHAQIFGTYPGYPVIRGGISDSIRKKFEFYSLDILDKQRYSQLKFISIDSLNKIR